MPDRDQGWQKARDQGCIVDMPRGQCWQTAMEQMDQAQGKQTAIEPNNQSSHSR